MPFKISKKIISGKSRHLLPNFLIALLSLSSVVGCNVTGGIDAPSTREENLKTARLKLNDGDCQEAIRLTSEIGDPNDDIRYVRGWAHLCKAGGTFSRIGTTLLNFNTTSNDLTVVGKLADSMSPGDADKVSQASLAIEIFNGMTVTTERSLNIALANVVKASAILAKASSNAANVRKTDIAPNACSGNCTVVSASCTAVRMNDTDATDFYNAITSAASVLGGATNLSTAKDLVDRLNSLFGSSAAAAAIRCQIYNSIVANP